ncbi:hypothetical protein J6590_000217 [Homalodisca vitripennis]|nr:hypothetical protein J6590_000217 [Homalodisca vitripennis]
MGLMLEVQVKSKKVQIIKNPRFRGNIDLLVGVFVRLEGKPCVAIAQWCIVACCIRCISVADSDGTNHCCALLSWSLSTDGVRDVIIHPKCLFRFPPAMSCSLGMHSGLSAPFDIWYTVNFLHLAGVASTRLEAVLGNEQS